MTDTFHHYRHPGPRQIWGYLTLHGRAAVYSYSSAVHSYFFRDFLKISFVFYLFDWLRLLLIVCGNIESNPGPDSDRRVPILYSSIRGLHANLDELAVAGSDYNVWVYAESEVYDLCHLSELHIPGFGCPCRIRNPTKDLNSKSLL